MQRFLVFCAGAKWKVLERCPTQKPLYVSMGLAVLLTAVLAAVSGSYALYTVFENFNTAIAFGVLWGITIFNLDRLIIMSIRKRVGTPWWRNLLQAMPRLVLAIFISFVIAKPLEIKLFESKLEQQLEEDRLADLEKKQSQLDILFNDSTELGRDSSLKNQIRNVEASLNEDPPTDKFKRANTELQQLEDLYNRTESINTPKIRKVQQELNQVMIGYRFIRQMPETTPEEVRKRKRALDLYYKREEYKDVIARARNDYEKQRKEVNQIREEYENKQQEKLEQLETEKGKNDSAIITINRQRDTEEGRQTESLNTGYSKKLVSYLDALGSLTENNRTMWWANLAIMLLFIALETAPVLAKLMISRTKYDELLEVEEQMEDSKAKDKANMDFALLQLKNEKLRAHREDLLDEAIEKLGKDNWQKELASLKSDADWKKFIERVILFDPTGPRSKPGISISYRSLGVVFLVIVFAGLSWLAFGNLSANAKKKEGTQIEVPTSQPTSADLKRADTLDANTTTIQTHNPE